MSWFHFQDFSYSFLSILFEGIPFVLLGAILSGIIDAFVPSQLMTRILPRNRASAIWLSALLGLVFPMCECGSVVVIRRFIKKGLPVSSAVTYMLAAPIVNPVVALSTYAAFRGQNPWVMASLRLLLGFGIAVMVGFITRQIRLETLLRKSVLDDLPKPELEIVELVALASVRGVEKLAVIRLCTEHGDLHTALAEAWIAFGDEVVIR